MCVCCVVKLWGLSSLLFPNTATVTHECGKCDRTLDTTQGNPSQWPATDYNVGPPGRALGWLSINREKNPAFTAGKWVIAEPNWGRATGWMRVVGRRGEEGRGGQRLGVRRFGWVSRWVNRGVDRRVGGWGRGMSATWEREAYPWECPDSDDVFCVRLSKLLQLFSFPRTS